VAWANAALHLAAEGVDIIGTYNSRADEAQALVAELEQRGAKAVMLQLDVGRSDSFADFASRVEQALQHLIVRASTS
jgi:NAD(P)-dependent dehydrogenase (short-subunit alcohol dehydrogenase family)